MKCVSISSHIKSGAGCSNTYKPLGEVEAQRMRFVEAEPAKCGSDLLVRIVLADRQGTADHAPHQVGVQANPS